MSIRTHLLFGLKLIASLGMSTPVKNLGPFESLNGESPS